MSSNRIHRLRTIFTSTGGGCGCRPKPTDIIDPQPKSKSSSSDQNSTTHLSSGGSSATLHGGGGKSAPTADDDACSSSTTSATKTLGPCQKIEDISFAVVKDSDDPYQDFRQSMLQMIFEKEIYSTDDLQQLLDCFLKLNSPHHHEVIVRAFVEIWNGGC